MGRGESSGRRSHTAHPHSPPKQHSLITLFLPEGIGPPSPLSALRTWGRQNSARIHLGAMKMHDRRSYSIIKVNAAVIALIKVRTAESRANGSLYILRSNHFKPTKIKNPRWLGSRQHLLQLNAIVGSDLTPPWQLRVKVSRAIFKFLNFKTIANKKKGISGKSGVERASWQINGWRTLASLV